MYATTSSRGTPVMSKTVPNRSKATTEIFDGSIIVRGRTARTGLRRPWRSPSRRGRSGNRGGGRSSQHRHEPIGPDGDAEADPNVDDPRGRHGGLRTVRAGPL